MLLIKNKLSGIRNFSRRLRKNKRGVQKYNLSILTKISEWG